MDGININQEQKIGLLHNMNGERPQEVSIDELFAHELGEYNEKDKQALSDLLDMIAFLESGKKNIRQGYPRKWIPGESRYKYGPADGYYQLESTSRGGGYTRADKGYSGLEKEFTPQWFHDKMVIARKNNYTWTAVGLDKDQQDFVMASYLLNHQHSKEALKRIANEDDANAKLDIMINYWLDHHWAGWQGKDNEESLRANKKAKAQKEIVKDYKYDPNWISLIDSLDYNFDMGNYG